jgi:hypothetical protein
LLVLFRSERPLIKRVKRSSACGNEIVGLTRAMTFMNRAPRMFGVSSDGEKTYG